MHGQTLPLQRLQSMSDETARKMRLIIPFCENRARLSGKELTQIIKQAPRALAGKYMYHPDHHQCIRSYQKLKKPSMESLSLRTKILINCLRFCREVYSMGIRHNNLKLFYSVHLHLCTICVRKRGETLPDMAFNIYGCFRDPQDKIE